MGHQLLTRACLATLFAGQLLWAQGTIEQIDRLVNQIKTPRVGLDRAAIVRASDPFVYIRKGKGVALAVRKPTKRRHRFTLSAIINDRVKINGRWYRVGERLHGYLISAVDNDTVVLRRFNKTVRITMPKSRSKRIKLIQFQGSKR